MPTSSQSPREALASDEAEPVAASEQPVDGRSTRWDAHRTQRRAELVAATLRAIRSHGAVVGMDDIAAVASTSKTVFYRHFEDRAGLYRAVAEEIDIRLFSQVARTAGSSSDSVAAGSTATNAEGRDLLRASVETYLRLVEDDPEVYRFVVSAPLISSREGGGRDLAADATAAMSGRIVALLVTFLEGAGQSPERAERWARAVVGLVRSAGDDWLRAGASRSGTTRADLVDDLTALLWDGLASVWEPQL